MKTMVAALLLLAVSAFAQEKKMDLSNLYKMTTVEDSPCQAALTEDRAEKTRVIQNLIANSNKTVAEKNARIAELEQMVTSYRMAMAHVDATPAPVIYEPYPLLIPTRQQSPEPVFCSAVTVGVTTSLNCR